MGGKPCVRGLRVTVGAIVGQIGAGRTVEQVLADYPYLQRDDVLEALRYAAWRAQEREVELANANEIFDPRSRPWRSLLCPSNLRKLM